MDVSPVSPTSTDTAGAAKTPGTTTDSKDDGVIANRLSGDFTTFLKLLTAQMENQDPLSPTDNTEFVAQLASFSGVEQQVKTNDALEAILKELTHGVGDGMAQWIGKRVLIEGGLTRYAGAPVDIEADAPEAAERRDLVVRNDGGAVVARLPVGVDATELSWDGRNQHGATLPEGLYSFTLESYEAGVVTASHQGRVFSTVHEVRRGEEGMNLIVDGGKSVDASRITALR